MTRTQTTERRATSAVRRTSQYTLTIPGPDHADADRQAALDVLVATVNELATVQGAYLSDDGLSVCWRAVSDFDARMDAVMFMTALDADPLTGSLHTGYGISRRDFPVIPAGDGA